MDNLYFDSQNSWEISNIDSSSFPTTYTVEWTDGSQNIYDDIKLLKQMADQAQLWKVGKEDEPVQVFPKGTLIYENFPDKFCEYQCWWQ